MKRTIGFKMTALFVLFSLILCLALSIFSYLASWKSYGDIYANNAKAVAEMTASLLDGGRAASYLRGAEKDAYYGEMQELLNNIKRELDLMYLYLFVPGADSFTYIIEAELDGDDPDMIARLGDVFEYTRIEYDYLLPDVEARRASSEKVISYNEAGYGQVVSAWAPLFASNGDLAAMVEVDIALTQVERSLSGFLAVIVLLSSAITVIMVVGLLLLMRRMIAKPLGLLTNNVLGFASGDRLAAFADDIQTGDEMQTLSEAFGKMAEDIDRYVTHLAAVTADRERIATELNVATKIQADMLPCIFPAFPARGEFDLYASMLPAREVGGDFYDFFLTDENTLAVVIADVSGKGVPAALFMVIAKTLIKNNACAGKPPGEVFTTVNNLLCENNDAGMFVTAFMGYLDIPSGRFTFVNAGHNPPLIRRAGGEFGFMQVSPSFILAGFEGTAYREQETVLGPGDMLFIYTDGVTEAMNRESELFSDARLEAAVNKYRDLNLTEMLAAVKTDIDLFADGAEQADDITMLALRING